jgi:hypothetical protein
VAGNSKRMFDFSFKKIREKIPSKKIKEIFSKCYQKVAEKIAEIPEEYMSHIRNVLVLVGSYSLMSFLIYPELKIQNFVKEVFSLLCAYGAIFFWFMDRIDNEIPFRIAIAVTACVSPVLFINNPIGVAIICLLMIVFCEFIIFEYIRGCNLFSNLIPVYIICENEQEAETAQEFSNDYKILELIVLASPKNGKYSSLKSIDDIKNWLRKINYIPFYPSPKRFMYFSGKINTDNFAQLLELSAECSTPLFRITKNIFHKQNISSSSLSVSPVFLNDLETTAISPSDRTALSAALKGKRIWICYDGRGIILDLIGIISLITSVDLTIFCESERLMLYAKSELANNWPNKNYKIKIVDINLFNLQGTKPDVLFYNMPIKSFHSGEENLKEAVIKNVLDTKRMIDFSQSNKIPFVFILSNSGALNANNWIGATQRLGELFAQFADSQSRKTYTKFKIIRIPEEITDLSNILGDVLSSIFSKGYVNVNFLDSELAALYYKKDILPPLLKTIVSLMKNNDTTSSIYTIAPKNDVIFEDFIKNVCNVCGLRKDKDVQVVYNCPSEEMKLDDFVSISESMEKTAISNVLRTKFTCINSENYEHIWTIEEINGMTTRELIAAVFQSLNEKIHT